MIIHPDVTISKEVTIIGPTVVGSGSRVKKGAVIAHSVLLPGSVVAPWMTIRETLVTARPCRQSARSGGESAPSRAAFHLVGDFCNMEEESWRHPDSVRLREVHQFFNHDLYQFSSRRN